jgi:hypothetical protein
VRISNCCVHSLLETYFPLVCMQYTYMHIDCAYIYTYTYVSYCVHTHTHTHTDFGQEYNSSILWCTYIKICYQNRDSQLLAVTLSRWFSLSEPIIQMVFLTLFPICVYYTSHVYSSRVPTLISVFATAGQSQHKTQLFPYGQEFHFPFVSKMFFLSFSVFFSIS